MELDLSHVEALFFTAMQTGYAGEGPEQLGLIDWPGHKEIRYEDGDFVLVDRWAVNPGSKKSAGTTTIWYQNKPVWFMSYGGFYPQEMIHFLKAALRMQYCTNGHFNGGRGPKLIGDRAAGRIYRNQPVQNDFGHFSGREEIVDLHTGKIGYHDYWGMSLI